jgi:hypothetical protein
MGHPEMVGSPRMKAAALSVLRTLRHPRSGLRVWGIVPHADRTKGRA